MHRIDHPKGESDERYAQGGRDLRQSYGGASGGLRAVEHLSHVFAELHAVGIRDGVMFPNAWEQFDEHGQPLQAQRYERGMQTLLARLAWWAETLRQGRAAQSYGQAVMLD